MCTVTQVIRNYLQHVLPGHYSTGEEALIPKILRKKIPPCSSNVFHNTKLKIKII